MIHKLTDKARGMTVPKDSWGYDLYQEGNLKSVGYFLSFKEGKAQQSFNYLPFGEWKILGLGRDLTEDQWREVVETVSGWSKVVYYNYSASGRDYRDIVEAAFDNATESGTSLLRSKGLQGENTLILVKQ